MGKKNKSRNFTLLIKPASADCNLRCSYCFYLEKHSLYPDTNVHRMSDEVLERMISSYLATVQPAYSFGWQGGEPTIMGLDFFKKVTALQQKYGKPGSMVSNGLQTNATLIDDAMAEHFAEYHFLLGVSLDGPEALHNKYRLTRGGEGTHHKVLEGIEHLKKHNVEFNILVLVSTANVDYPEEVYDYLTGSGFFYHQYIPCVEFDENGKPLPWTITGEQWGSFLNRVYDRWFEKDTRKVSIRAFDALLDLEVNNRTSMCTLGTNCRQYFVVEHNGDVYPCDFFVEPDLRLGNIFSDSWNKMINSERYKNFGRQKSRWNERCVHCPYLKYCAGDCLKHRLPVGGSPKTLSWLCRGFEMFLQHALPGLKSLADTIRLETHNPS